MQRQPTPPRADIRTTPNHVLIVDDEALSRDMLVRRLASRGFRAEGIADARICLGKLGVLSDETRDAKPPIGPDIILLDVNMPGMSGLQLLREIRQTIPQERLPIILVTAMGDSEDVVTGLEAGANDYVVKPVDLAVLIARIRVCLAVREAVAERARAEQALRRSEESLRMANEELDMRVRDRTLELARSNSQLIEQVQQRERDNDRLMAYQDKLRALAAQVAVAEEQERRRIARGMHDQVGQTLALAKLKISSLQATGTSDASGPAVEEVRGLLEQAIRHTRSLTFELGARVLYEFGLETAIESLADQIQEQQGIQTSFEDDGKPKPLAEDIQVAVYQGVRELLHNVVKHARAEHVHVSVKRDGSVVRVSVRDNGVGFLPEPAGSYLAATGGFGLFSIRERLDYIGGSLIVQSDADHGTCATLSVPIAGHETRSA